MSEQPLSSAEVRAMLEQSSEESTEILRNYLTSIALAFTAEEAFAVIAYVDTPDVLD